MKFGLTKEQYNYIRNEAVAPLKACGAEVYCYGSRARGDHQKFSDLDLMVEGPSTLRSQIALIKENLSNSNFPYKVDLVLLDDFAHSYLSNYKNDKTIF